MQKKHLSTFIAAAVLIICVGVWVAVQSHTDRGAVAASFSGAKGYASSTKPKHIRKAILKKPDQFLYMTGGQVTAVLDQPHFIRKDYPTVVWQYQHNHCVLDVYFASMDMDLQDAPIVHYELRDRTKANALTAEQAETCLKKML